ncbi:MAG: hypothetical protein HQ485_09600 [Acidobacteria bacterium]|nr:hypothetical protein [Acidobacteriota bacterium]
MDNAVSGKLLAIGLLSAGCLVAVTGGYFVLRESPTESASAAAAKPASAAQAQPASVTPAQPVAEIPAARVKSPAAPDPAKAERPQGVTDVTSIASTPPAPRITVASNAPPVVTPLPEPPEPALVPALAESPVPLTPALPPPPAPTQPANAPTRYVPDLPSPPQPALAEPPLPQFDELDELIVDKHSVIGIRLDDTLTTKTARVEDRISATVSRDVTVAGRTAIPAGVRLEGTVVLIERGGRFKNRPRIGLRFERVILADGTRLSISTDTIFREGDNPTANATAKVGAGAVAGAILGAVLGGKKGAAIGSAAGAAGGAAAVMKDDEGEVKLPAGAPLTVRLNEDVTIVIR